MSVTAPDGAIPARRTSPTSPPNQAGARPGAPTARPLRGGLLGASSLATRFLLANLVILVVGGLVIGAWIGSQLERGIVDRSSSITALYVQSFIEPRLESLATADRLPPAEVTALDNLLRDTPLGQRVVSLRVWSVEGEIVYSPDRALIGQRFPVEGDLAAALTGQVTADMSNLEDEENALERQRFDRLLEMYVPVRERGTEWIIAVAEFYQLPTEIDQEVADARLRSWLVVAAAIAVSYLLLYGIVRQGSNTILRQEGALREQVGQLSALLEQNDQLRDRVRAAAERTTTLNERSLRRISADLHDGPAQMLALALLRLDALRGRAGKEGLSEEEYAEVQAALSDALRDMRGIAAGLRLPELASLSTTDAVRRAVEDHRRRSAAEVGLELHQVPEVTPLPVKIALFRALQELLSNSTRHGGGAGVRVRLSTEDDLLTLAVSDTGPGFDVAQVGAEGRLGLAGIREQAELLGGTFEVTAAPGGGSEVRVAWPLARLDGNQAGSTPRE